MPVTSFQRDVALRNLQEQGMSRPAQYDDEPVQYDQDGSFPAADDPESPGHRVRGGGDGDDNYDHDDDSGKSKRRSGCSRCCGGGGGITAAGGAGDGGAEKHAKVGAGGIWGNVAALLSLLNPIAATGCGGLCLPATTGLLANVASMLGMGAGGGSTLVAYATLLLLFFATLSVGHSAKVRGGVPLQWGLAVSVRSIAHGHAAARTARPDESGVRVLLPSQMVAMLVYNMGRTVLRSETAAGAGQVLLCVASFWNAWENKRLTNGGVNCMKPKRYKLFLPGPLRPLLIGSNGGGIASGKGKKAGLWVVPNALVMLTVICLTCLPFAPYAIYGLPDSDD